MNNLFYSSLVKMAAIFAMFAMLISCNSDDDVVNCYVDKKNLSFDSKKSDVRELTIVCSGEWELSGVPEWLIAESTKGTGRTLVKFTTKKANGSSVPNEGLMKVMFYENAEATASIAVVQQEGAITDCEVKPNLVVALSNGIAFDLKCDKNVARYYRGYIEASSAGIMSDDEIIKVLERDFTRHVPEDDEVADFDGLKAGTRYILYTLGYNKSGDRGDLISTEVSTLACKNYEPIGRISNLRKNGLYWNWTVTKSATCSSYYMMTSENSYVANASDVLQAWWLEFAAKNGIASEYVNGTDWKQEVENASLFAVWTRGVDARGNMSGTIDWKCIKSNTTRSVSIQKGNATSDHSGKKLSQDDYKIFVVH